MKRILLFIVMVLIAIDSMAQFRTKRNGISFGYDVDFAYLFDNREFQPSNGIFDRSKTFNSARLAPTVMMNIRQNKNISHSLKAGIEVMKNMGEAPFAHVGQDREEDDPKLLNLKQFREIFFYYELNARSNRGILDIAAGTYPRNLIKADYSRAMRADELYFYDSFADGLYFSYKTRKFFSETGLDWKGMAGEDRRERFELFGNINWTPTHWFCGGISTSLNHIANSELIKGVIDNCLFNPYLKFDLSHKLGIQEASLKTGALVAYQCDRKQSKKPTIPSGMESILRLKNHSIGIENTVYVGNDLMPFRDRVVEVVEDGVSVYEILYAETVYCGSPFYHIQRPAPAFYDRLELFWEPHIADCLDLKLSVVAHFNDRTPTIPAFAGWQQRLSIIFDLEKLKL